MHKPVGIDITEPWIRPRYGFFVGVLIAGAMLSSCTGQGEQVTDETEAGATTQPRIEELETRIEDLQNQIAEKEATLAELREDKERLEEQVPQPFPVAPGDSHWSIGFRYLTEERGVDEAEARRQLARAALVDPILEGFEIWNFYDGEHFGSFPIQDEAQTSPGALLRAKAEEAKEEHDRLATRVAELQGELRAERRRLERRIAHLEDQVSVESEESDSLRNYIDSLRQRENALRERVTRLEEHLSSVHYVAGTRSGLQAEGKVEASFLNLRGARLGELASEDFDRRIDLREESRIELRAEDFGVSRIEGLELLPQQWEENRDYRVSIGADGKQATLELLEPNRFRLETIVIIVNS